MFNNKEVSQYGFEGVWISRAGGLESISRIFPELGCALSPILFFPHFLKFHSFLYIHWLLPKLFILRTQGSIQARHCCSFGAEARGSLSCCMLLSAWRLRHTEPRLCSGSNHDWNLIKGWGRTLWCLVNMKHKALKLATVEVHNLRDMQKENLVNLPDAFH
jgi:hypothetical protein